MTAIAFIGLGNMGGPMATNLIKAGHRVVGYDLDGPARERLAAAGGTAAASAREATAEAAVAITMLPAGRQVRDLYLGADGLIERAAPDLLLIDCSTIDVESARAVGAAAAARRIDMVDAPVSGGVAGAQAATLTFMVGGTDQAVARARPVLEAMGRTIVHTGPCGNGQAAKICNNLILAVSMVGVCEAFALGHKLGLDPHKLFEVSSQSSGQCWSLTSYCPVPGPVPKSPANHGYAPGFAAALMLKDLKLAQQAAQDAGAPTPLGAGACALYQLMVQAGQGGLDFSAIYRLLAGTTEGSS
jgi:3-hydroxyisobutyrate dehydrogenase